MDTRQLRYIIMISECGSVSKAAEKLFISQSGLNQQLARIEKELGTKLFDRTTHSLEITPAGEIYVDYAKSAIAQEERIKKIMNDVNNSDIGEIRLNLAMEHGINLFTEVFPAFHQRYPRIEFRLEDHTVSEQYQLLEDGQLDIGMVMVKYKDQPNLEYIHLADERFLVGIPIGHPLAKLYHETDDDDYPEIDLAFCKDEPFSLMFSGSTFRQVVDPCFKNAGFEPNVMFESRTNHIIAMMVKNGICLTIFPESQAIHYLDDIRWFRLEENPSWESCLIYHKENPPRKAGRYFIELAIQKGDRIGRLGQRDRSFDPHSN